MDTYKHHKNSLEGMLEANGTVEEYDFNLPETSSSNEDEHSARSKQRQQQRFQVHCLK
jgi:hypothetical protein